MGEGVWGKLYHEHDRGMLDVSSAGEQAVHPGEWNRYEILAVEHRIWIAINGRLAVAAQDPVGELSGLLAFQLHAGPPQEARFRKILLDVDPDVEMSGIDRAELEAAVGSVPADGNVVWRGQRRRLVTP